MLLKGMSTLNKRCIDCLRTLILLCILIILIKELLNYVQVRKSNNNNTKLAQKRNIEESKANRTIKIEKKIKLVDDHFHESEEIFKEMMSNYYMDYDEYYRPMLTRAFNFRPFTKSIVVKDIQPDCEVTPFLLIQVHSAAININKRLAIRHSWARYVSGFTPNEYPSKSRQVLTMFVVGRSMVNSINLVIRREGEQYRDVLFNKAADSYKTLTNKTIEGLMWASSKCRPKYLLKTDDDCYVNIPNVMKFLQGRPPDENLYAGRIFWYRVVDRDDTSKYYTTQEEYVHPLYPPYASGGGYIISGRLIPKILNESASIPMVPNEDAYIGIIMASLNVPVRNHKKILPYIFCNETVWDRPSCDFLNPLIIHGVYNYAQIWIHYHVKVLSIVSGICKHSSRNRKHLDIPLYCYSYEDYVVIERLKKLQQNN